MEHTSQPLPAPPLLLWLALGAVVGAGALLDVMEVDAAQYASMARDMLHQPDKLKLYFRGADYLDKPPLLFWLSAFSFHLFGVHNWSYKLPSILAAVMGAYATFRYTRIHHGSYVAQWAAFLFASSVAFLLMTNDVRTDTLLTAAIITAIWTGSEFLSTGRTAWLCGASVAVALGMLAKGPMGFVAPALVLGVQVLMERRWKQLFDPRLLLLPLIVLLLLTPMLKGLFDQHGMHGLRFFFWEQSFGRITGENRWKDDSSMLYFTHELPWLMLPWTIFILVGWWRGVQAAFQGGSSERGGPIGALVLLVALSLSQFKLPHYLYPILPLLSVQGARAIVEGVPSSIMRLQRLVWLLLLLAAVALFCWAFPSGWPFTLFFMGALVAAVRYRHRHPVVLGAALWLGMAWGINVQFYPGLLRYQSNAQVGRWMASHGVPPDRVLSIGVGGTALEFYAGGKGPYVGAPSQLSNAPTAGAYVLISAEDLPVLASRFPPRDTVLLLDDLPVQLLSPGMLFPVTRQNLMRQRLLLAY